MAAILPTNLLPTYSGSAPADYYLDGSYTDWQPTGVPVPEYPFLNEGDTVTVIYRQPGIQALASYVPLSLTTLYPGVANAYPHGDKSFRDGGCGLLEMTRQFGNIPNQRILKGVSFTYQFQVITSSGAAIGGDDDNLTFTGATYTLSTQPFMVDSVLTLDYFLAGQEESYPLLLAPKAIQVGNYIQPRGVSLSPGGSFPLYLVGTCVCSHDATILAEDDTYGDWNGAIRYRQRRTIAGPTPAFWKNGV